MARGAMCQVLWIGVVALFPLSVLSRQAAAATDDEVVRAIERAKEYLINQQQADGSWPKGQYHEGIDGHTEMALFALIYIRMSPNSSTVEKGLDAALRRPSERTYEVAVRTMALAHVWKRVVGEKQNIVRQALYRDTAWLQMAQGSHGGWDYKSLDGRQGRYDLSCTQLAILALREAALVGVENIRPVVWQRTQQLYLRLQQGDGSWNYGEHNEEIGNKTPGYGTMSAAGLATLFITLDNLNVASGCPCRGSTSSKTSDELDRRIDAALAWQEKYFSPAGNPKAPDSQKGRNLYWLYSVERVGIAAGYKYFGTHDWYREGVAHLLKAQKGDGSFGDLPDTCFATMFLYKGRAPVLYSKLEFDGKWNSHRRDIANLTHFIERTLEQPFHWQIVSLKAPVEDLHDAPVLYITPESVPKFSPDDKKKLRAFTDTGGTILVEASCGNAAVKKWFRDFSKEVWPEWSLEKIPQDHPVFTYPYKLSACPELLGLDDGLRVFLFYSPDDVSCHWQTQAYAGKEYLFKWGIDLFTYATDQAPLRAKLASRDPPKSDRYASPVKAGDQATVSVARLKYEGAWNTGRHYGSFAMLAKALGKVGVTLTAKEEGVAAEELKDCGAAYMVGAGEAALKAEDREALKEYLAGGGFLWAEAAGGSLEFDKSLRALADEMKWELKALPQGHPMLTGKMGKAVAFNVASGVKFRRALVVARMGRRAYAELAGIYQGGKLVGVYSPFDVMFSLTPYQAYGCRGYKTEDALAVATNVVVFLTDRGGAE